MRRISTRRRWAGTKRLASTSISRPAAARRPRRRRSAPARPSSACPTWRGVLLFRGKGADLVGMMNVYANSPQGFYWLKSSGITGVRDLAGKKIGNPAGDGARTHVAGAGEDRRHRSEFGHLGQHRRQCQARRAQGQGDRRHDVILQPSPRVRARARRRHGLPGVEGRGRQSLRQFDHRQRRLAQGQPGQGRKVREGHAEGVRRLHQEARAVRPGAGRERTARSSSTTSWTTGIS